jgi:hypothetical protein
LSDQEKPSKAARSRALLKPSLPESFATSLDPSKLRSAPTEGKSPEEVLQGLPTYKPRARKSDPATSQEAAEGVDLVKVHGLRDAFVLFVYSQGAKGATSEEFAASLYAPDTADYADCRQNVSKIARAKFAPVLVCNGEVRSGKRYGRSDVLVHRDFGPQFELNL